MNALKILLGVLMVGLAWLVIFQKSLIFKFNAWIRNTIFADQWVLFSGMRVSVLLLLLGGVALFSGVNGLSRAPTLSVEAQAGLLKESQQFLRTRDYPQVITRCKQLVKANPNHADAWALLATAWWASGNKRAAIQARDAALRLDPKNPIREALNEKKPGPEPIQ